MALDRRESRKQHPAGRPSGNVWAVVLAAGAGTRLQSLTASDGEAVPKQFCSLRGRTSLLRLSLQRAASLVPEERVLVVVAEEHHRWWSAELADLPPENVLVQPRNRGTAAGILLPLLELLRRDPSAHVLVLPADHYVADERALTATAARALGALDDNPHQLVLLGATAEQSETGFGWIVPAGKSEREHLSGVAGFREKPPLIEVDRLLALGALINTFIFCGRLLTLLRLYGTLLPELAVPFSRRLAQGDPLSLDRIYDDLPERDFSRDLLERSLGHLLVAAMPPCGWSDLGTPERVARCLEAHRGRATRIHARMRPRPGFLPPIELSERVRNAHC